MLKSIIVASAIALGSAGALLADDHKTPFPDGAELYFIGISDGDSVSSPVTIRFGLSGMGIAPAGITEKENVGHHHLLLNRPPLGEGEDGAEEWEFGLASDEHHMHFGGGQTEVTLELQPGEHTLQMVLGDHSHVPFGPDLATDQITIKVE